MAESNIWKVCENALVRGDGVCLVVMVDAEGSGPNRPGACLAVTARGERCGTVGGGTAEYALVEKARRTLDSSPLPQPFLVKMEHREVGGVRASGMICDGTQQFALCPLGPDDLATVRRLAVAEADGRPGVLTLSAEGLSFCEDGGKEAVVEFDSQVWCYRQTVGVVDTATLIGGGHVSLALTPLLTGIGMRVVVLDNREGLATMEANDLAAGRRVIDYADVRRYVPQGCRSFVCIMTFGHRHDEEVLEQLVEYPLRYLGMMGSAAKIGQIRRHLLARGVAREALDAIYAPIGIPIGSNTPQEIAISIAAEIVAVRTGHLTR